MGEREKQSRADGSERAEHGSESTQSDETEYNGVNKINKHGVILPRINFREEVTRAGQLPG